MADIAFISIIGKANDPIFFKVYGEGNHLELQFAAFASLDMLEEDKFNPRDKLEWPGYFKGRISSALLFEYDYELYSYVLPTGIKILVAFTEASLFDLFVIKKFFEQLHLIISERLCNPFLTDSFESPELLRKLENLLLLLRQGKLASNFIQANSLERK